MTYADSQESLQVLVLGERAGLREIKTRHRELVKRHHPDAGTMSEHEAIQKIYAAYRIVMDYVTDFRFSFAGKEFYEQNPEEHIRHQFMDFYNK